MKIWLLARKRNGWIPRLEWMGFEKKEIEEMENYEDYFSELEKNYKEAFRKKLRQDVKKLKGEVGLIWANNRRFEYLDNEIKRLEELYEKNKSEEIEKKIRKYKFEKKNRIMDENVKFNLTLEKYADKDMVTDEDIENAMNFPFDLLLEFNTRTKMASCPFHEERSPSFKVGGKFNRGHCFGCGWDGTPIDFVMKKDNIGFIDAVKILRDK